MPIIKSAIKRAKQTVKRRERNVAIKRDMKTAYKAFIEKPTAATLSAAHSEIDTAVKKNLIKKNTAARRKSNISKLARVAGVKLDGAKKAPVAKAAKPVAKAVAAPTKKPVAKKAAAAKPAVKKAPAKKPAAKKTTK